MSDGEIIVLRDEVRQETVLALAEIEGWSLRGETSRAHLVLGSRRWATGDRAEVTYIADHPGAAQSLIVTGPGAVEVALRLRERLPHHEEAQLLATVLDADEPDPVQCIRVASKLAACRPEACEPRHLAALERLLGHPETAVRRAGIRSAYSCAWTELRALVERRCSEEQQLAIQLEHLAQYLSAGD
ncbi:MAG: hypothetical protein K0V04_13030 [Deltaproteobacteria bacterium]|nr:hypothetical protein [Deltaproteobacteria bacterium]